MPDNFVDARFTDRKIIILVGIFLLLWTFPHTVLADHVSDHEHLVSEVWIGLDKDHLIKDFGPPISELEIPGPSGKKSYLMVYPKSKLNDKNTCIDTFVLDKNTNIIVSYYCR